MKIDPYPNLFYGKRNNIKERISENIPSVEMYRSLGSGTEAAMASIRVARLATGKRNVVKMGGAYFKEGENYRFIIDKLFLIYIRFKNCCFYINSTNFACRY